MAVRFQLYLNFARTVYKSKQWNVINTANTSLFGNLEKLPLLTITLHYSHDPTIKTLKVLIVFRSERDSITQIIEVSKYEIFNFHIICKANYKIFKKDLKHNLGQDAFRSNRLYQLIRSDLVTFVRRIKNYFRCLRNRRYTSILNVHFGWLMRASRYMSIIEYLNTRSIKVSAHGSET